MGIRPDTFEVVATRRCEFIGESFCSLLCEVRRIVLNRLGLTDAYTHMGRGEVDLAVWDKRVAGFVAADLARHGRVVATIVWGEARGDFETIAVCQGNDGETLVGVWIGEDGHRGVMTKSEEIQRSRMN